MLCFVELESNQSYKAQGFYIPSGYCCKAYYLNAYSIMHVIHLVYILSVCGWWYLLYSEGIYWVFSFKKHFSV